MYRPMDNDAQGWAYQRLSEAIAQGRIVQMSVFTTRHDEHDRPMRTGDGRPLLKPAPVQRTIEPYELYTARSGKILVRCISHSSPGEEGPVPRTYRLDRIARTDSRARNGHGVRLTVTRRPAPLAARMLEQLAASSTTP